MEDTFKTIGELCSVLQVYNVPVLAPLSQPMSLVFSLVFKELVTAAVLYLVFKALSNIRELMVRRGLHELKNGRQIDVKNANARLPSIFISQSSLGSICKPNLVSSHRKRACLNIPSFVFFCCEPLPYCKNAFVKLRSSFNFLAS